MMFAIKIIVIVLSYILNMVDVYAAKVEVQKEEGEKASAEQPDSSQQMTWDSYVEYGKNGDVSSEVTQGVKVEDIIEKTYEYHYASFGKEDPFVPPILASSSSASTKVEIPIVSVLQKYHLNELKIVGLWQLRNGEKKVLIMTPKDEGVVSVVGDMIGQKGGKIIKIEKNKIVVREFTLALDGTREYVDVDLSVGEVEKVEKEVIVMKNGQDEEGVTNEELLPAGLLENDPDIKARKDAAVSKFKPKKENANPEKNEQQNNEANPDAKKSENQQKAENAQNDLENIEKKEEEKVPEIPVENVKKPVDEVAKPEEKAVEAEQKAEVKNEAEDNKKYKTVFDKL